MQRYALELAAHDYTIEYKNTRQHTNADGLSRVPLPTDTNRGYDATDVFYCNHLDTLPVTAKSVAQETRNDPVLARVFDATSRGWGKQPPEGLGPYFTRRHELSIHQGCVMWGIRVVIPKKLQPQILSELHSGHQGVVRMKSLARSYTWWPGIDLDIEHLSRKCSGCQMIQNMPPAVPLHPWDWPERPWQRIHIDFAGPFMESMFLVIVDAHSKWPEVIRMKSTTAERTVEVVRSVFARYGVPEQLVTDNGPQFVAESFQQFLKANGIRHIRSAPYHPATNGLAERFVQTFKQALRAMKGERGDISVKLARFLLQYRKTPHATTGESPAMLFLG